MLYVVATPIGNLEDISPRALRILKEVDFVLAEDTRVTRKLLSHYDIHTPIKRFDSHTTEGGTDKFVDELGKGKSIALVSDAGTPCISDPGSQLVSSARDAGHEVVAIPGPSAVISALSISGLPVSSFLFLGFLPHKKGREKLFAEIAENKRTVVFYESPHRILKTLTSLSEHLDDTKEVVVARELTKIYEQVVKGEAEEVLKYFEENTDKQKGEFVVIVGNK